MAQNYTVRMKDGTITLVDNVVSETIVHEEVYDLTNYRDIVDSAFAGAAISDFNIPDNPVNAPTGDLADGIIHTSSGGTEGYASISDPVSHIPPRNEAKKRSRLKLWSNVTGTGEILFAGWIDRIEGYSTGTFIRL